MKSLDIFLKALKNVFVNKIGIYVYQYRIEPTKINCIEKHSVEVWLVDGKNKTLITSTTNTYNNSLINKGAIEDELSANIIENILKYYGL